MTTTSGTRASRTPPARGRRDRGVFQSVFVGLLLIIVLIITTSLVVLGPKIGGQVASYLICQLFAADNDDCNTQQIGPDQTQEIGPDPTVVATVELPGNCDDARAFVDDMFPGGQWTGQDFQNLGAGVSVPAQPGIHLDPGVSGTVKVVGCTLVFSTTDDLSNKDDARTDIDWVAIGKMIAAASAGVAAGALVYTLCIGTPAAPACSYMAGYAIGFFWNIAAAALDHGTLNVTDVINAMIAGVAAALPAGYAKYLKTLGEALPGMLTAAGEAIEASFTRMWGWVQDIARAGKDIVVDWTTQAARYLREHPPWQARPGPPAGGGGGGAGPAPNPAFRFAGAAG